MLLINAGTATSAATASARVNASRANTELPVAAVTAYPKRDSSSTTAVNNGSQSTAMRSLLWSICLGQMVSLLDTISALFVKLLAKESEVQFPILQYIVTYFGVCVVAGLSLLFGPATPHDELEVEEKVTDVVDLSPTVGSDKATQGGASKTATKARLYELNTNCLYLSEDIWGSTSSTSLKSKQIPRKSTRIAPLGVANRRQCQSSWLSAQSLPSPRTDLRSCDEESGAITISTRDNDSAEDLNGSCGATSNDELIELAASTRPIRVNECPIRTRRAGLDTDRGSDGLSLKVSPVKRLSRRITSIFMPKEPTEYSEAHLELTTPRRHVDTQSHDVHMLGRFLDLTGSTTPDNSTNSRNEMETPNATEQPSNYLETPSVAISEPACAARTCESRAPWRDTVDVPIKRRLRERCRTCSAKRCSSVDPNVKEYHDGCLCEDYQCQHGEFVAASAKESPLLEFPESASRRGSLERLALHGNQVNCEVSRCSRCRAGVEPWQHTKVISSCKELAKPGNECRFPSRTAESPVEQGQVEASKRGWGWCCSPRCQTVGGCFSSSPATAPLLHRPCVDPRPSNRDDHEWFLRLRKASMRSPQLLSSSPLQSTPFAHRYRGRPTSSVAFRWPAQRLGGAKLLGAAKSLLRRSTADATTGLNRYDLLVCNSASGGVLDCNRYSKSCGDRFGGHMLQWAAAEPTPFAEAVVSRSAGAGSRLRKCDGRKDDCHNALTVGETVQACDAGRSARQQSGCSAGVIFSTRSDDDSGDCKDSDHSPAYGAVGFSRTDRKKYLVPYPQTRLHGTSATSYDYYCDEVLQRENCYSRDEVDGETRASIHVGSNVIDNCDNRHYNTEPSSQLRNATASAADLPSARSWTLGVSPDLCGASAPRDSEYLDTRQARRSATNHGRELCNRRTGFGTRVDQRECFCTVCRRAGPLQSLDSNSSRCRNIRARCYQEPSLSSTRLLGRHRLLDSRRRRLRAQVDPSRNVRDAVRESRTASQFLSSDKNDIASSQTPLEVETVEVSTPRHTEWKLPVGSTKTAPRRQWDDDVENPRWFKSVQRSETLRWQDVVGRSSPEVYGYQPVSTHQKECNPSRLPGSGNWSYVGAGARHVARSLEEHDESVGDSFSETSVDKSRGLGPPKGERYEESDRSRACSDGGRRILSSSCRRSMLNGDIMSNRLTKGTAHFFVSDASGLVVAEVINKKHHRDCGNAYSSCTGVERTTKLGLESIPHRAGKLAVGTSGERRLQSTCARRRPVTAELRSFAKGIRISSETAMQRAGNMRPMMSRQPHSERRFSLETMPDYELERELVRATPSKGECGELASPVPVRSPNWPQTPPVSTPEDAPEAAAAAVVACPGDGESRLARLWSRILDRAWSIFAVGSPAFYFLVAMLDVQAGVLAVVAFNYANLASSCLIDWVSLLTAFLLAVQFMGEEVTSSRITALSVGFAGSLCILASDAWMTKQHAAAVSSAAAAIRINERLGTPEPLLLGMQRLVGASQLSTLPVAASPLAASVSTPVGTVMYSRWPRVVTSPTGRISRSSWLHWWPAAAPSVISLRGAARSLYPAESAPVTTAVSALAAASVDTTDSFTNQLFGDLICVLSAVLLGIVTVMMERALEANIPVPVLLFKMFGTALIIALGEFAIFELPKLSVFLEASMSAQIYFAIAALSMTGAYCIAPIVLGRSSSAFFNLSLLTSAGLAVLLSAVVLGDPFPWLYSLGLLLILGSLFVYYHKPPKQHRSLTAAADFFRRRGRAWLFLSNNFRGHHSGCKHVADRGKNANNMSSSCESLCWNTKETSKQQNSKLVYRPSGCPNGSGDKDTSSSRSSSGGEETTNLSRWKDTPQHKTRPNRGATRQKQHGAKDYPSDSVADANDAVATAGAVGSPWSTSNEFEVITHCDARDQPEVAGCNECSTAGQTQGDVMVGAGNSNQNDGAGVARGCSGSSHMGAITIAVAMEFSGS